MDKKNSIFDQACNVWSWEQRSISRLRDTIDPDAFAEVVQLLRHCSLNGSKVLVSGCGTSGTAARKACYNLCSVGVPAFYITPGDGMHATLGMMQKNDVCVLFSKGGNREEMLEFQEMARQKKVKTVACTASPASPLALRADSMLLVAVEREADAQNSLATNSTLAMISAFDAVAVAIRECT